MSIEEMIFNEVFPCENFDWSNYYDWVAENPTAAYHRCLHIATKLHRKGCDHDYELISDKSGLFDDIFECKKCGDTHK